MESIAFGMQRVVFFLDYANINRAAKDRGYDFDYAGLLQFIGNLKEGRFLVDAYSYVPIDPRNQHKLDGKIEDLWSFGYFVQTKVGTIVNDTYRCNLDIEMTMDILKVVYQAKPDIIVLATGDCDFVPLILEIRKAGIRVEVASFKDPVARELVLKCSGFINLDEYCANNTLSTADGQDAAVDAYEQLIIAQMEIDDTNVEQEQHLSSTDASNSNVTE